VSCETPDRVRVVDVARRRGEQFWDAVVDATCGASTERRRIRAAEVIRWMRGGLIRVESEWTVEVLERLEREAAGMPPDELARRQAEAASQAAQQAADNATADAQAEAIRTGRTTGAQPVRGQRPAGPSASARNEGVLTAAEVERAKVANRALARRLGWRAIAPYKGPDDPALIAVIAKRQHAAKLVVDGQAGPATQAWARRNPGDEINRAIAFGVAQPRPAAAPAPTPAPAAKAPTPPPAPAPEKGAPWGWIGAGVAALATAAAVFA